MKKLIVSFSACCLLSFTIFAPVAGYSQNSASTSTTNTDKDGTVKMKDGKMMVMQNGSWSAMASTTTMSNGSKVMTDGTIIKKDGTKKMLKNGDCVKPDGTIKPK